MIDYSPWVTRAERFVRQLDYLPGQWGISVSVDPPLGEREADDLDQTLPFGLPAPLRDFYVTGSASCHCTYHWSPDEENLARLRDVFPHQYTLGGGPRIIPAGDLADEHSVHDWADMWAENPTDEQAKAIQVWRATVPFLAVGNGDYLALHIASDREHCPVVYLCHDDDERPVRVISPSFDAFLADWQTLYYVGPEIWLLYAFLDNDGVGPLNVDQVKTRTWREIVGQQTP